jgi:hypothetical protein
MNGAFVGERRAALIVLLFCLCLLVSSSAITFASSDNWSAVSRLSVGGGISTTETFTINHVDWRIKWEIEPSNRSERTVFTVYIYQTTGTNASSSWFESIQHYGTETTSGVLYIDGRNGSFIMSVLASIESYTMIIEQNLTSIPELPSWIPMLTIFLFLTIIATIYRRSIHKHNYGTE